MAREPSGNEATPCVWMAAGLIAWRLCDREFDCERCPFDAAMRGCARAVAGAAEEAAWDFPSDRLYHPAHMWVMPGALARVRCGMDAFAARLLRRATAIVLPADAGTLAAGQAAAWLGDESELIPLRAPVDGEVVARNPAVQGDPALAVTDPYGDGWLFDMRCAEALARAPALAASAQARRHADEDLARLERRAARWLEQERPDVGPTMADGGERLGDLRRVLGAARYRRLILPFLE